MATKSEMNLVTLVRDLIARINVVRKSGNVKEAELAVSQLRKHIGTAVPELAAWLEAELTGTAAPAKAWFGRASETQLDNWVRRVTAISPGAVIATLDPSPAAQAAAPIDMKASSVVADSSTPLKLQQTDTPSGVMTMTATGAGTPVALAPWVKWAALFGLVLVFARRRRRRRRR